MVVASKAGGRSFNKIRIKNEKIWGTSFIDVGEEQDGAENSALKGSTSSEGHV